MENQLKAPSDHDHTCETIKQRAVKPPQKNETSESRATPRVIASERARATRSASERATTITSTSESEQQRRERKAERKGITMGSEISKEKKGEGQSAE